MTAVLGSPGTTGWRDRWRDRWARHLVASLERRLEREACAHDGVSLCPLCRLVVSLGFLPAPAIGPGRRSST